MLWSAVSMVHVIFFLHGIRQNKNVYGVSQTLMIYYIIKYVPRQKKTVCLAITLFMKQVDVVDCAK